MHINYIQNCCGFKLLQKCSLFQIAIRYFNLIIEIVHVYFLVVLRFSIKTFPMQRQKFNLIKKYLILYQQIRFVSIKWQMRSEDF